MHGYWQSTRHPWPCLLFVLPLLAAYEAAMLWQAIEGQAPLRAGLDLWLYRILKSQGIGWEYAPTTLIALICISWAILKWDRSPPDALGVWVGMFLECVVWALTLWGIAALLTASLAKLSVSPITCRAMAYLGSGLYEEVVFRLLGFGFMFWLFKLVSPDRIALILALAISAVGFAAAHHAGPQGETWEIRIFLFRAAAGACFAGLFHFRGLGVAVGTHSAYNLIVGLTT